MKILQVNKFYYPKGGADKYFLNLSKQLTKSGDELAVFCMHHPKNLASPWSKYFLSQIEFNQASLKDKLRAPGRIIYSLEAKKKFKKLLENFPADIIHLHNIYHQISPSILDVAKKFKIPVIIHLHDYKLICPNYQLFVNNKTCQSCKKRKYYHCLFKKCFKNSLTKSALASLEMYIHHSLLKIYQKNIDHLISPSQFLKHKFVEFGWPEEKISVLVNPFDSQLKAKQTMKRENYLLYFGRLSEEKGIETLIDSLVGTNQTLKILGTGPSEEKLKERAKKLKLKVDFLGFKEKQALVDIILPAKAVIIPSIWWENMPLNMLEALSLGKVVIASNIGGIPEIIKQASNGLLFKANSSSDLRDKIRKLNNLNLDEMSIKAKESVAHLSEDNNLKGLRKIYQSVLKEKNL